MSQTFYLGLNFHFMPKLKTVHLSTSYSMSHGVRTKERICDTDPTLIMSIIDMGNWSNLNTILIKLSTFEKCVRKK